jgi:hypothetical protein
MPSRHAVLLTPSVSIHLRQLLSCQQPASVNPLDATLIDFSASAANKRLTAKLNSLDATLTKNRGEGSYRAPRPLCCAYPRPTKSTVPLSFQPPTNCPFSIPFVLTFIHVMGGCTPPPNLPTFKHSNVQTLPHPSPVPKRTVCCTLPSVYSPCAILPSLRPGDRPLLLRWRSS